MVGFDQRMRVFWVDDVFFGCTDRDAVDEDKSSRIVARSHLYTLHCEKSRI